MRSDQFTRILIIEDQLLDRELYKRWLDPAPAKRFEFAESASATAGIKDSEVWRPDCILLDFNLPDMDGIEVLERLRGDSNRPPCAVVIMTAHGDEELAVRAMKAGATDYLPKGHLAGDTLLRTVTSAIDRFRMQQQIEQQQSALDNGWRRYQVLLEAIPQMVWTIDNSGQVEYANRRWIEYTGMKSAALLEWDRLLHPEDCARTWSAWNQAMEAGSVFEIEHRLRSASDGRYRWYLVRGVPMRNGAGEIASWFGSCTEIEDQKRAERVNLEQQKRRSIGLLAGGIAHDFNNLLTSVLGGAICAMDSLPAAHPARNMLEEVVRAGERGAELTRKMLAYAGKGNVHAELTYLDPLVRDTCEIMRAGMPKNICLEYHRGRTVPPVKTDAAQMRQVVVDLVTNAVEAIGEGASGRISVRTAVVEIDAKSGRNSQFGSLEIPAGRYVTLEVRDTGCGMTEETRNRIFDPFFTTKFLGRGLGLAAVHGFVRSNGGGVQVDSAPGKGTRFRVLLPVGLEKESSRSVAC